jgi:hypothetical protein
MSEVEHSRRFYDLSLKLQHPKLFRSKKGDFYSNHIYVSYNVLHSQFKFIPIAVKHRTITFLLENLNLNSTKREKNNFL